MSRQRYDNCRVLKIIDGHTVEVAVDLGFGITTNQVINLLGYKAAETWTVEGQIALSQLSALCLGAEVILDMVKVKGKMFGILERKTDHLHIHDEMIRLDCADKVYL